jgi:hypothetical protein
MKKTPVPVSGIFFFWAGFVSSISFMEAWLKFRAPGVTLEAGLSIGKLIFTALNRMEWVFVLLLMIWTIPRIKNLSARFISLSGIVVLILIIQTFLLLPVLNERVEIIIAGSEPGESSVHMLFGIAEIIKVLTVLYLGYYSLRLFGSKTEIERDNRTV